MSYYATFNFERNAMSSKRRRSLPSISPTAAVESFGWGDFPIITSEDLPIIHKASCSSSSSTLSDATSSTVDSSAYEDDSLPDSDVEERADERVDCISAVSTSGSEPCRHIRQVSFGDVHVREHCVVLGVHPSAAAEGYPLELGWDYNETRTLSMEQYEQARRCCSRSPLRLSSLARRFKLAETTYDGDLDELDKEEAARKRIERDDSSAFDHFFSTSGNLPTLHHSDSLQRLSQFV